MTQTSFSCAQAFTACITLFGATGKFLPGDHGMACTTAVNNDLTYTVVLFDFRLQGQVSIRTHVQQAVGSTDSPDLPD